MGVEVFHHLKAVLHKRGYSTAVGDEGGFAPNLKSNEEAIEVVLEAITAAGYKPGEHIAIALDPASSEFYDKASGKYVFKKSDKSSRTSEQMTAFWAGLGAPISHRLHRRRPRRRRLGRLETPDARTRQENSTRRRRSVRHQHRSRLQRGISEKIGNSILIKLNQIGTVTETIEAIEMARKAGYASIVSHRSGETEDTFIADLVVAMGTGQIKTGSASRTDRVAKYNQLLRIEEELGAAARFPGRKALAVQ